MSNPWDNSQLNSSGLKSGQVYQYNTVRGFGYILGTEEDGPMDIRFNYCDKVKFYEISPRSRSCCSADGFEFPPKREPKIGDRLVYFGQVIRSRSNPSTEYAYYAEAWAFYDELPLEKTGEAG